MQTENVSIGKERQISGRTITKIPITIAQRTIPSPTASQWSLRSHKAHKTFLAFDVTFSRQFNPIPRASRVPRFSRRAC
jgi:hypothetical protein